MTLGAILPIEYYLAAGRLVISIMFFSNDLALAFTPLSINISLSFHSYLKTLHSVCSFCIHLEIGVYVILVTHGV